MGSFSGNRRQGLAQPEWLLALAFAAVVALCLPPQAAPAKGEPLQTALIEWEELNGAEADIALRRAREAGVTAYRIVLNWYSIAPFERPAAFNPEDPADPAYRWAAMDSKIQRLNANGVEPILSINYPPVWAGGAGFSLAPDAVEMGRFLRAAARRYSGAFQGLPRVRLWQMWNEANVDAHFSPQFDPGGQPVSPAAYRRLVNEGYAGVKSVHGDNVVIAGGLSPFAVPAGFTRTMAPLRFMRDLFCLSNTQPATATCNDPVHFDVWAAHPYTRGGPTHKAEVADDASLGDLPAMQALLASGARVGNIVSSQTRRLWVTEFSWDTAPPDPRATPLRLQARWVSEALYRMWQNGVSLVTWLQLRDHPFPGGENQAGLFYRGGPLLGCDTPKLSLPAFRFPFVAFRQGKSISIWGRTPGGRPGQVVVEQVSGKKWARVASLRTDGFGIFSRVLKTKAKSGTFVQSQAYTRRYRDLVVCDGASSYWRLGERTGDAARDELGARPGKYEGGVALAAASALRADNDPSARLVGGESRVSLGPLFSPRTVEMWLNTRATFAVAFSSRNADGQGIYIGTTGEGRVVVFDTFGFTTARAVNDGNWHHVVYTYDGSVGRIYIDGAEAASLAGARAEVGEPSWVGYDALYKNRFVGTVDEVAVYGAPLSAARVRLHFQARAKNLTFGGTTKLRGSYLRARLASGAKTASLPFSLARVPDRPVLPFG